LEVLLLPPHSKAVLMGNEAIARGAIEAGIGVATGYPGTPSSEVIMSLSRVAKELGMYVEWAVNEKVALEIALGAAFAGIRSLATMKAPGANVASDSFVSAAYSGVNGGMVILIADDPGPHTTQTEQDSRWYADLAKLPMLEPSDPQEAKDLVVKGYDLSESLKLPVILRTTTRVNHTVGDVVYGEMRRIERKPIFIKDVERYVRASMVGNLMRHKWLNNQLAKAEEEASKLGINRVEGDGNIGIITSGVSYSYVIESLKRIGKEHKVRIIKIEMSYPLPKSFLLKHLKDLEKALVVEELDPYLELKVRTLAHEEKLGVEIWGKKESGIPIEGELNPFIVMRVIAKFLDIGIVELKLEEPRTAITPRPPPMCAGCPHRFSYYALLKAIKKAGFKLEEVPIMGDIGCYALSYEPPLEAIWTEHAMGASIGLALGLKVSGLDKPVVATIGDSTFFHAGIPPLLEAVHKNLDVIIVILDNEVVAMTGHQSTPEWSVTESGRRTTPIDILSLVKGLGVRYVKVINPYNINEAIEVFTEALLMKNAGPRVIISKAPCALMVIRQGKILGPRRTIDYNKCRNCLLCIIETGCPALTTEEVFGKKRPVIVKELCVGCGHCAYVCPFNAIIEEVKKSD